MTDSRRVTQALEDFAGRVVRTIALDITANLQESNPVDTGFSRANWVPRIGVPFEGTAGTRGQAEDGIIDSGPQQAGVAEVAGYQLDQGTVFISNNVEYVEELDMGSSAQAPEGFVRQSIEKALFQDIRRLATARQR